MKVSYDANATCPEWEKFIDDTVAGKDLEEKQAMKDYLQMIAGMALSGYSERRKTFHMYGPPGSGKSLFQNTLRDMFGDYATTLSASALSQPYFASNDAKHPEIAGLVGKRIAMASEMGSECHWNDDLVKRLTGGDEMTARRLYENPIRYRCKATIMSCGNGRPAHSTTSPEGLMSRLDVVPFPNAVPVERQDKELPAKLKAEFSGILNWAV